MFSSMALLWKPCFQVWPFYGNHVSKYDPFMQTMFSSMALVMRLVRAVDYEFYKEHFVSLLYFRFSLGYFPLLRVNKVLLKKLVLMLKRS